MAAIKVNKEIFEALKNAYSERFGASPMSLIKRLNQVYKDELEELDSYLISPRTIRNFFNSSEPPNMLVKNLNYLCFVLLDYKSYQEAFKQLINNIEEDIEIDDIEKDFFKPYWEHLERKCGTMRVLDMAQPVRLNSIYVDLNCFKDIPGRKQQALQNLIRDLSIDQPENLKRLSLLDKENQIPGLEAVKSYQKLMILGKPGAGKTTFLKYLAINSNLLEESIERLIPVFIPLREFSENENLHNLTDAVVHEFTQYIPNYESQIKLFLEKGKFLILLDGLDEVLNHERIYQKIEHLTNSYPENRFIITCRTGASDYVFKKFTEVEAVDFDREQVEEFARNWFTYRGEVKVSEEFLKKLQTNQQVKELATNPLLLTILCWTFEDSYDFTRSRYGLYADAVDSLLRRWDASRRIERKSNLKLSRQRKIAMFSQIAYDGLNHNPPKLLWQKWELEQKLVDFIESISFEIDTYDVLREIEANYGLLIQKAKRIYSFSHLTFQEYFAAEYIVENREIVSLEKFVEQNLMKRQWREVFILITERLNQTKVDEFLKLIFKRTNDIIKNSKPLQDMLQWLSKMTINAGVKSSSWRALYLALDLDTDLYISNEINIDRLPFINLAKEMREFNRKRNKMMPATEEARLILYIASVSVLPVLYAEKNINTPSLNLQIPSEFTKERLKINPQSNASDKLNLVINQVQKIEAFKEDLQLEKDLKQLKKTIPDNSSDQSWQTWAEELRKIMREHLDIGYKTEFEDIDVKALENYIYSNFLFLECIHTENYSSKKLCEELFDNLLLPHDEISTHLLSF